MIRLLLHFFGLDSASGTAYLAWSGVLSDLSELTLIAAVAAFLRARNCEVKGCWRLGRHATAAGHKVCRVHHPDDHLTAQKVHDAHHAALGTAPPTKGTPP